MRRAGRFAVNVLGQDHGDFVARATPPGSDRFTGVAWTPGRGGAPLLPDALASLGCGVATEHPGGDHWIVVGRVDDLRISPARDPLIFFEGAFHALRDHTQGHSEATRWTRLRSVPPPWALWA
jgi:3-hydroxy-9,10-secoandrosta-1,3,5(10)-triene-9,17-dione monooxygenase reductase component